MFTNENYEYLYQLLNTDMLTEDCGTKCGKFCCVGTDDGDYAFKYLLPGEELFLIEQGFHEHASLEDFGFLISYRGFDHQACPCQPMRNYRPFCCRMFPYRPQFNNNKVIDIYKTKNANFYPCWIGDPLKTWRKRAIEAWNYLFSDRDNLIFYARYYLFLKKSETPGSTFSSVMADEDFCNEVLNLNNYSTDQLWDLASKLFAYEV